MNSLRVLGFVLIGAALVAAGVAGVAVLRALEPGAAVVALVMVWGPLALQIVFGWSLLRK